MYAISSRDLNKFLQTFQFFIQFRIQVVYAQILFRPVCLMQVFYHGIEKACTLFSCSHASLDSIPLRGIDLLY